MQLERNRCDSNAFPDNVTHHDVVHRLEHLTRGCQTRPVSVVSMSAESAGGAADEPRLCVLQRACNGLSSTALGSHRHHPCSWPSSRSGRRVSSSAKADVQCGRTASLRATSGRLEHVRDVNRAQGACGWLYPPRTRSVSCDRGPPSASSDSRRRLTTCSRGPSCDTICDGCAAPLATSGS